MVKPRVALSKDFMESYSRLPRSKQKKVREFTARFQQDPTHPGIHFEKVNKALDDKVRSVRIDQEYRAIVIQPPRGDVFLCVWVDHHDEAYAWAEKKRFDVNPKSGTFQLYEAVEAPQATTTSPGVESARDDSSARAATEAPSVEPRLFDGIDDEDLLLAAVPEVLLENVRKLQHEDDLDRLAPYLPNDAAQMLYHLAAGYSLMEAMEELDRAKPEPELVDVDDFETALDRPVSQEHFKVVSGEQELEVMLDAPLEKWRVFLHPSQRKLVTMNANGPVRVLGGAGTGKTVVLMHRAKHLAENVFADSDDQILVTTFTKNLAINLEKSIGQLCGDVANRIQVAHLHSWASNFLRNNGAPVDIIDFGRRQDLFDEAIAEEDDTGFEPSFFMEEWDHVVQPQEVTTRDDYLTARRTGRGTRIGRKQRAQVWKVLARYRELLDREGKCEWADMIREARLLIEKGGAPTPFRAVLSDEVQDFSAGELKLLRALAPDEPNTLFLVGDGHQRIYGSPIRLGSCGIEIRGRSRRLKLNYRTTEQIRDRAVAILEGCEVDDLDGGTDTLAGYCSLRQGPLPVVEHFESEAQEANFIQQTVRRWIDDDGVDPTSICVTARSGVLVNDRYEPLLRDAKLETVIVKTDPEGEATRPGVRVATMHRMKGLEFLRVIVAGVNSRSIPGSAPDGDAEQLQRILQERCLLYVAATRARDSLVITGFGDRSPLLG